MVKERLDVLLTVRRLAESRERAKTTIMAGLVLVDGQKVDKAGTMVKTDADIRLLGDALPYVSRGGWKLAKALDTFGISLTGRIMADIGASTGGFTDCALQNGAAKVYAIDVGYGQLAWKLRTDDRVVNMERVNIRYVKPEDIGEVLDFASIDVAFISLTKVLEPVKALLHGHGEIVALIKPQFEAGRERVGKNGVVRDPAVHEDVIQAVLSVAEVQGFARSQPLVPQGLTYSPVKGPEGNIEYLLYLTVDREREDTLTEALMEQTVAEAHHALDRPEN